MSKHTEILKRANNVDELKRLAKDLNIVEAGMTEQENREVAETFTERYNEFMKPPEPMSQKDRLILAGLCLFFIGHWIYSFYF